MKRLLAIVAALVAVAVGGVGAQEHVSVRADYEFGQYLIGGGHLRDALTLAQQPLDENLYAPSSLDSLHFLRGWTHYNLQQFSLAADHFGRVEGAAVALHPRSVFYGVVCNLHEGDVATARQRLEGFAATPTATDYAELLALQRGGIALLEGDVEGYNSARKGFLYEGYPLADSEQTLDRVALAMQQPLKKPWVAGALSAVVPGLGRIYAGDVGQGIASFMLVGLMAGLTAESWHKAGTPQNWRTVLYGSVGSLLYISEIFGSAASVRVYHQQQNEAHAEAVMYSIHIPLRTIFK